MVVTYWKLQKYEMKFVSCCWQGPGVCGQDKTRPAHGIKEIRFCLFLKEPGFLREVGISVGSRRQAYPNPTVSIRPIFIHQHQLLVIGGNRKTSRNLSTWLKKQQEIQQGSHHVPPVLETWHLSPRTTEPPKELVMSELLWQSV